MNKFEKQYWKIIHFIFNFHLRWLRLKNNQFLIATCIFHLILPTTVENAQIYDEKCHKSGSSLKRGFLWVFYICFSDKLWFFASLTRYFENHKKYCAEIISGCLRQHWKSTELREFQILDSPISVLN